MNTIREISRLNALELEKCVPPEASWHTDYRDTAYIHIGSLPFTLTEGDILTIFSQYGTPTFLHLVRDKETGKSKGFGWLKYEDQRSCDLAVDNLGGAEVLGRTVRVDHARYESKEGKDGEKGEGGVDVRELDREEVLREQGEGNGEEDAGSAGEERELLREEVELRRLIQEHDEDDPMKGFLIEEKKAEVARAVKKLEKEKKREGKGKGHRHRRDRRDRREINDGRRERDRDARSTSRERRRSRGDGERRHRATNGRRDSEEEGRRRRSRDDRRRDSENDRRDERHPYRRRSGSP